MVRTILSNSFYRIPLHLDVCTSTVVGVVMASSSHPFTSPSYIGTEGFLAHPRVLPYRLVEK